MSNRMNLLCFSDLHLDVAAAKRIAARALTGNIELLVSAGDLALDGVHDPEIYRVLTKSGVPVVAVPGNHDGDQPYETAIREAARGWASIDGGAVQLRPGAPVAIIPGHHGVGQPSGAATRTIRWANIDGSDWTPDQIAIAGYGMRELPQDVEHERRLCEAALMPFDEVPGRQLVVASHLPPAGTLAAKDRRFVDRGSQALTDWIERRQPAAVICGHVHHPEPVVERLGDTLIVNPGPWGWLLSLPL